MLNKDYTAKLLNLEDVIITDVKNLCNEVHISLQLPRKAHVCPACGAVTDRIHDYRMQTIKDVPWSNGFIEGCNNKTKVLKRVCFGMRNFRNFGNRILFSHA